MYRENTRKAPSPELINNRMRYHEDLTKCSVETLRQQAGFIRDALNYVEGNPACEKYMRDHTLKRLAFIESLIKEKEMEPATA